MTSDRRHGKGPGFLQQARPRPLPPKPHPLPTGSRFSVLSKRDSRDVWSLGVLLVLLAWPPERGVVSARDPRRRPGLRVPRTAMSGRHFWFPPSPLRCWAGLHPGRCESGQWVEKGPRQAWWGSAAGAAPSPFPQPRVWPSGALCCRSPGRWPCLLRAPPGRQRETRFSVGSRSEAKAPRWGEGGPQMAAEDATYPAAFWLSPQIPGGLGHRP